MAACIALFWKLSLNIYNPGWSQTQDPPASASEALGLQRVIKLLIAGGCKHAGAPQEAV